MTETRFPVDSKSLGRLDALPGSLGKVTLCATLTLGIAAFVSVRKWMASRAAESAAGDGTSFGFRSKAKTSSAGAGGSSSPAAHGTSISGSGRLAGAAASATAATGQESGQGGANGSASPLQRPQLPPRNYFTIRAALHVKRHNAKLMEWYDEQLGIQLPFSPQFFELKQEERQAPLILLTFRTLREATHRMAVTVEELYEPQSAAAYREASLSRVVDCARLLGTSATRIAGKEYPTAEYCYLDEAQAMVFVLSIFVVHERLAVTLQYVAPTRVRPVLPSAFYDVVRLTTFAAPSPSPSYLLVSEPRLGLGYHLPLDFLVHEGLAESDGVEERLFTSVGGGSGGGGGAGLPPAVVSAYANPSAAAGAGVSGGGQFGVSPRSSGRPLVAEADWAIPYVTAMSRGGRRMGLVTSYEPALSPSASGGGGDLGSGGVPQPATGGGVPYAWRPYLEQQVCKAVRQLGLVLGPNTGSGGSSSSGGGSPRVVFQPPDPSDTAAYASAAQTLLVEPYPLSVALNGNFSSGDELREEDGEAANITAFSLCREVRIDVNSSYVTLVPDTLEAGGGHHHHRSGDGPTTVRAYWSAFYVPVGTACVSFHFIASALRHTSTEFVSFCAAVMNSVSLGNHYGQAVSVLYCNTRHDALPFRLSLPPTGMATVEEPMLADPLCVVQATYGVEKVAVTVRVFPLFTANAGSSSSSGGAAVVTGDGPATLLTAGASTNGGGGAGRLGSTTPSLPAVGAGGGQAGSLPTPGPQSSLDGRSNSPAKAPRPLLLRPGERRGTRQRSAMRQLQFMIRYYLHQFPGGVQVVSYTRTAVNSMPAVLLCFRPMWYADDGGAEGGEGGSEVMPSSGGYHHHRSSSHSAGGAVANWDDFGGGSSQGASSWLDSRDAMLEDEVGQLNPFAQYFSPPPPPASYVWAQQQQQGQSGAVSSPVAVKRAGVSVALAGPAAGGAGDSLREGEGGDFFCPHGSGDSQRSQDEVDAPLRVAMAVCCEGNAFLFQSPASEYTLGIAQQAVQTTATHLALIPRGSRW